MNYYYRSIPSEQMSDYSAFYEKMADELPDEANIIELGISEGRGIIMMAALMKVRNKRCRIWGVDIWDYGGDIQRDLVTNNIIRSGEDNITILTMSSLDASCKFEDNFFHLAFIDSTHTYQYTKAEIRLWIHKVAQNGVLSGHDYIHAPAVRKAVDELVSGANLKTFDTAFNLGVWYFQRTEDFKLLT